MKELIIILSIFSAVNAGAISWLFWRSKNGWLRKLLIFHFSAVSFGLSMRFLSWYFGWEGEIVTVVVLLPVSIALFALTLYLYNQIKGKP